MSDENKDFQVGKIEFGFKDANEFRFDTFTLSEEPSTITVRSTPLTKLVAIDRKAYEAMQTELANLKAIIRDLLAEGFQDEYYSTEYGEIWCCYCHQSITKHKIHKTDCAYMRAQQAVKDNSDE